MAAGRLNAVRPPQERPHACNELADAERLGEIVVGAGLETQHLVGLLAPRRQHENRHGAVHRVAPDGAAERHTVEAWQHDVEDEQVEEPPTRFGEAVASVRDGDDIQPLQPEVEADEVADVGVVLHQEDTSRRS